MKNTVSPEISGFWETNFYNIGKNLLQRGNELEKEKICCNLPKKRDHSAVPACQQEVRRGHEWLESSSLAYQNYIVYGKTQLFPGSAENRTRESS